MISPETSARKLAAKRTNERVKLLASSLNALSLGVAGAAIVIPGVSEPGSLLELKRLVWFFVAAGLHLSAQYVFRYLRSED
ncbi:MAG TPA: hypothetical protein VIL65_00530 [Beijerinckiaceae bacterium]